MQKPIRTLKKKTRKGKLATTKNHRRRSSCGLAGLFLKVAQKEAHLG